MPLEEELGEQPLNSRSRRSSQPSRALQPPQKFERLLQVVNMSEDDWEPDLDSEEEPPSDDESRGRSDGAGSSMGSDSSENEEDWQAGSEPHRPAGNRWLVEDHTTGDEVRQARSKTGASYPDRIREDSDSKRHADQELTALRIQILEERRSDSARAYCDPEAARRLLERDEKELRDFKFFFGSFRKNIECQDPGDLRTRMDEGRKWVQEHFAPWAKSFLETRQRSRWKEMTDATNHAGYRGVWVTFQGIRTDTKPAAIQKLQALGIISEKKWWNDMEFLAHRLKSGRIEHTTITVRVLPNESLRLCFMGMEQSGPRCHV